jgi:hypothetical protein
MARWKDKALATLDGSESIPVTQGTTDKRTTVDAIRAWIAGQFGSAAQADTGDFDAAGAAASAEAAAKAYADTLVVGLVDDRGNYDASSNLFPAAGGSGAAGAVLKGDLWTVSVAGALGGVAVTAGDLVRALVDTPGQTAGNWAVTENNIGYVPEPAQTAASQAEAEAGTGTSTRSWTPQRIWQAIAAALALGTWISGATGKATPVDADTLPLSDSAASNALKKLTWANLKATLKTYFDTLYEAIPSINAQTGTTYTAVLTDRVVTMTNAAANTFTVPPNSSVAFPIGSVLEVWQGGAGQTTIAAGSGVTIKKGASDTLKLLEQEAGCSLRKTGTDTWRLVGKMEPA